MCNNIALWETLGEFRSPAGQALERVDTPPEAPAGSLKIRLTNGMIVDEQNSLTLKNGCVKKVLAYKLATKTCKIGRPAI